MNKPITQKKAGLEGFQKAPLGVVADRLTGNLANEEGLICSLGADNSEETRDGSGKGFSEVQAGAKGGRKRITQ